MIQGCIINEGRLIQSSGCGNVINENGLEPIVEQRDWQKPDIENQSSAVAAIQTKGIPKASSVGE
jgi:hypothetical protein